MNSANDVAPWIERAEEDYKLAGASIRRKQPLTYGATFHAQQCVEKYLKALLTLRQINFPRTHDLAALYSLCKKNNIFLPVNEDDLDKLTAYAVEVRYPGMLPSIDEAKEAIKIMSLIRKRLRRLIGL